MFSGSVPHDLGVLGHFKAVVWYLGDNRLTQDKEDVITDFFPDTQQAFSTGDAAVAERQQFLTMAVRDYLNEGGKLAYTGETTGYYGVLGTTLGGIYHGLNGAPEQDCVVTDDPFSRLARTVDLTTVPAADTPQLGFAISFDTEPGFDNVIVEAHTVGQDDWTTLPESGGRTDTAVPDQCEAGFLIDEHPFLAHYLTPGDPDQGVPGGATGSTGAWNRMTGDSGAGCRSPSTCRPTPAARSRCRSATSPTRAPAAPPSPHGIPARIRHRADRGPDRASHGVGRCRPVPGGAWRR